jgi:hypothetical protein
MSTVTKTKKQMVMATATLILQHAYGDESSDLSVLASGFEHLIDTTDVLRRVGAATTEHYGDVVEVRCDVEYGPVWATEADMRRHLQRQTREFASILNAQDFAVFNVAPVEVTSSEQLDELIGNLTARSNDIRVPLPLRKQLATVVGRLRRGVDAGRVRRTSHQDAVTTMESTVGSLKPSTLEDVVLNSK